MGKPIYNKTITISSGRCSNNKKKIQYIDFDWIKKNTTMEEYKYISKIVNNIRRL